MHWLYSRALAKSSSSPLTPPDEVGDVPDADEEN